MVEPCGIEFFRPDPV
ncbi:unnamed protein product, partial [Didymodactylos carnosus]